MALTSFWPLDDNAASTTIVATTGSNGTLEGGDNTDAKDVTGPGNLITAGLALNGTDDAIVVSGFTLSAGSAGSISIWFRPDSFSIAYLIAANASNANGSISASDSTTIRIRPGISATGTNFTVPTMSTGTWYHLLVAKDASDNYRVFLNGEESSSGTQVNTNAWAAITRIGRNATAFAAGAFAYAKRFDTDESANAAALYAEGAASAPENVTPPAITGTATQYHVQTCSEGTWTEPPTSLDYQWELDTGSGYVELADISGATYHALTPGTLRCGLVATNAAGSSERVYSDAVAISAASAIPPRFFLLRDTARITTTGTKDFQLEGAGRVRGAFLFGAGTATVNNTPANGLYPQLGVSTHNNIDAAAVTARLRSGVTQSACGHYGATGAALVNSGTSNAPVSTAAPNGVELANGLRLAWGTVASAEYFVHLLMLAGDSVDCKVDIVTEPRPGGATVDFDIAAGATCGVIIYNNDDMFGTPSHNGYASFGLAFWSVRGSTVRVASLAAAWQYRNSSTESGDDLTHCFAETADGAIITIDPTEHTDQHDGEFTLSLINSTTLRLTTVTPTSDASAGQFACLSWNVGGLPSHVGFATLPAETGEQTIELGGGFTPQMVLLGLSSLTAVDTFSGDSAAGGVVGVACVTRPPGFAAGNAEFSATVAAEYNQSTTDTQSLSSDSLINLPLHDGTTDAVATFDSFDHEQLVLDISDAPASARVFPYLAVADSPSKVSRARYVNAGAVGVFSRASIVNAP